MKAARDIDAAMFRQPRYERPAVERYLRVDVPLPNGGVIDLGLEDRADADAAHDESELQRIAGVVAALGAPDARRMGATIETMVLCTWPDRYWFAEIYMPGAPVSRFQILQPAVVGGFRR